MALSYPRPPVQEAICEFHFSKDDWTFTTPGDLYRELREQYPAKPETMQQIFGTPAPQPGGIQVVHASRIALKNLDGSQALMAAPGALSVHAVGAYPGFEEFHGRMRDALARVRRVTAPEGLRQIGLRYVNRILLPRESHDLSSWLVHAPVGLSRRLAQPLLFAHQQTFACPGGAFLILNLATPQPSSEEQDYRVILLDLNALLARPQDDAPEWDDAFGLDKVRELHEYVSEAFESSITDSLREHFRARDA